MLSTRVAYGLHVMLNALLRLLQLIIYIVFTAVLQISIQLDQRILLSLFYGLYAVFAGFVYAVSHAFTMTLVCWTWTYNIFCIVLAKAVT